MSPSPVMKINKYIHLAVLPVLLIISACSSMQKDNNVEINKILLTNYSNNIDIFVTLGSPPVKIKLIILEKNKKINIFGVDFILLDDRIEAMRGDEKEIFKIPGSYYINISRTETQPWESGKTFEPFEGKSYPSYD